jgi:hypothetical protein
VLAQEVADRRADDVLGLVEFGVERIQKVVALARVEVPGVLAVEGDGDQEVAVLALLLADPAQPAQEVGDRVQGRHPVVVEADQVGELGVAEDQRHLAPVALHEVRRIEDLGLVQTALAVTREADLQRAREHVVVGDEPLHPGLDGQRGHRVADRHLARPHAARMHAHQPLE